MGNGFRDWDKLPPDILALIFTRLSICELLTVVPAVCKSWQRVVLGPYCWQCIDLRHWGVDHFSVWWPKLRIQWRKDKSMRMYESVWSKHIDRMLRIIIPRTCGSLQVLFAPNLCNTDTVMFIANNAQSLKVFGSRISPCLNDAIIIRIAPLLSNITSLDLSYCMNIKAVALREIGKHCKFLTSFYRVMEMEYSLNWEGYNLPPQDNEAMAIASTMLRLKDLHIRYLKVSTKDVEMIVENCKDLEYLDIRGCFYVILDAEFLKRFSKLKIVRSRNFLVS